MFMYLVHLLYSQNTTNPETAFYELFTIPKDTDPTNPECT